MLLTAGCKQFSLDFNFIFCSVILVFRFFDGDRRSLFTEAWHSNRPKTEQEIIDEITSKTTSEVVKRSILDGVGKWKGLSILYFKHS